MSKRKYTHFAALEPVIIAMWEEGHTNREITDHLGVEKRQIECWANRRNRKEKTFREANGLIDKSSLVDQETERYVHTAVFPYNAFASLEMSGVQYAIDRDSIQSHLCQNCLNSINSKWFTTQPPAEYGIVSFDERTIQPLLNSHPWFSSGKYSIDCEFKQDSDIDLLIHYAVNPHLAKQ